MCVPQIGQFFKVRPQNWGEWLFALAVGFGSIIVALLTKLLSRCAFSQLNTEHRSYLPVNSGPDPGALLSMLAFPDRTFPHPLQQFPVEQAAPGTYRPAHSTPWCVCEHD